MAESQGAPAVEGERPSKVRVDNQEYIEEKRVTALFEMLYHELLIRQPQDPIAFLRNLLSNQAVPKIIVSGPPAGGKGTQCQRIVEKYGAVHISTGDILREEVRNKTPLGIQAQSYMNHGMLVPDNVMVQLVTQRMQKEDVIKKGWLLDGFPRTRAQALAMQLQGIIPDVVILLDVNDEILLERIEGRRVDPLTGKVYHLKFNPPPIDEVDLFGRLEQRSDDTSESIRRRLEIYHRNERDIVSCYSTLITRVEGTRDAATVFEDIQAAIGNVSA